MDPKLSLATLVLCSGLGLFCSVGQAQEVNPAPIPSDNAANLDTSIAQALPPNLQPQPRDLRPNSEPTPAPSLPNLPPPDQLLQPNSPATTPPDTSLPTDSSETIEVKQYKVVGSTVFTPEQLEKVTKPFIGQVTFSQLLQARSAVTDLYVQQGYITSGAFLPEQTLKDGEVTIQVIEGRLSDINITGLRRLNPKYVRDRVKLAAGTPVNVNELLQGLQLLQLDPHIANISAELSAGVNPGESILDLKLEQAHSFNAQVDLNNGRVPSVGSFRRQFTLEENTLFGQGDNMLVRYSNTDGSNAVDAEYTYPVNARNGTVRLFYSDSNSGIIEKPFDVLDIQSKGQTWELGFRQPIFQTPTQEFATSLTFSHRATGTSLKLNGDRLGFPLSEGADNNGKTRLSVVRFAQEWTKRGANQVIGARSQFNFGVNWFGATDNATAPDSHFFSWQGQAQWVRQLAPDTLLLVRSNLQLADRPLLSLEQFGLGGFDSIRGYRQDRLLTDNGLYGSIEARIPIFRIREIKSLAQITPFLDWGAGWNSGNRAEPTQSTLLSVGIGLRWQFADRATARLDWGIPLINKDSSKNSLQESGILFSLTSNIFN